MSLIDRPGWSLTKRPRRLGSTPHEAENIPEINLLEAKRQGLLSIRAGKKPR